MKTLRETISESIFDKNLATDDTLVLVKGWVENFVSLNSYNYDETPKYEIDLKNKKISFPELRWESIDIVTRNQAFTGFIGFDFFNGDGKKLTAINFIGEIKSVENLPKQFSHITLYPDRKTGTIDTQVFKDITKYAGPIKSLNIFEDHNYSNNKDTKLKSLDASDLRINISNSLSLYGFEDGAPVKFNTDLKTNILSFGYYTEHIALENLPIFKTISFKAFGFNDVKNLIEGMKDKGKSKFDTIIVNGKDLNKEEKEAIKSLLKGEDSGFAGYGEVIKKLDNINQTKNDKDGTKDRFGEDLKMGDIVIVCDSTSPGWPSFLDIYKGCSQNGRIRTDKQAMVPPRNIIKLNNPKILELLK